MGLPLVKYTPDGGAEVTLAFKRGPADFHCVYGARVHDNVATSGAKERVFEALDMLVTFRMPALRVGDDLEGWDALMAFALAGGMFTVSPNADGTMFFHCVTEDERWEPARNAMKQYEAAVRWRIVPDAQAPASPAAVMRAFWGVA